LLTEHDSELVAGRKPFPDIPAAFLEVADRRIDGNDPRVLIDLRMILFRLSIAFVTGMRISVPMFGSDSRIRVYATSIRDRGTGSTRVRAGRSIR
jgi:hypothetical protein